MKLIQNRWNSIKIELPFSFGSAGIRFGGAVGAGVVRPFFSINVKGNEINETEYVQYYQAHCSIAPISTKRTYIQKERSIYIKEKLFLFHDEVFYLAELIIEAEQKTIQFLLSPKTFGESRTKSNNHIFGLYIFPTDFNFAKPGKQEMKKLKYQEWVSVKIKPEAEVKQLA